MNKKLICTAAVAALFSASAVFAGAPDTVMPAPNAFDGFYLGATGSFHHTSFTTKNNTDLFLNNVPVLDLPLTVTAPILTQNNGGDSTDLFGGFQGGFGKTFNHRWYAGVVGFAEFGDASQTSTTVLLPTLAGILDVSRSTKASVSSDYGVAFKPGVLLSPTTLAYAKLGAVWANIKVNDDVTAALLGINFGPAPTSGSSTEVAFLWGFGVEQFIYQDVLSLNVEYTFADFGSANADQGTLVIVDNPVVTTGQQPQQIGLNFNSSASAKISALTAGLNVHFGRDWL